MPPILLDGVRPCHREAVGALPPQSVTRRVTAKPQIEELSLSGKPTTRPLSRIRKHAGVRIYSLDRFSTAEQICLSRWGVCVKIPCLWPVIR